MSTFQKLKNITQYIARGVSPTYSDDGYMVVNQRCVRDNRVTFDAARFSSKKKRIADEKFLLKGDVLINSTGVGTLGRVAQLKEIMEGLVADAHVTIVRPKCNALNLCYFGYAIVAQERFIESLGKGATGQTELSREDVGNIEIRVPAIEEQKKISAILSAYDDLIENNTRRIQILEEMSQRIYREWFVNFRFPGHEKVKLVDSEMGKIPEGWEVKPLGEEVSIVRGKNLTKQKMEDGLIPVISAGISPSGFHSVSNVKAPAVTISASGANAGYIGFHMNDLWASDCSFFNKDKTEFIFFYYLSLLDRQVEVTNMQRGAAQPHVYPKDLMELKIIVPSENLIKSFDEIAGSFFKLIGNLKSKNENLKKSRDLLLPKLISGEVDVSELDIELKEEVDVASRQ